VPKRVDPEERRQAIAEAVYRVIGERGWEAVTLRDVASTAGISMGQVQHYFTTKTDMLIFALSHMRDRVLARLDRRMAALPQPVSLRDQMRATIGVMLPLDEPGRYARQVAYARAQLTAAAADGLLNEGIDPGHEAAALYYLIQGLAGPVLIGQLTPDQALDLLDYQLSRIFRQ
jgi:AcrR family transcriptional regulator